MTERPQQPTPGSEIILYQTEDGRNRVEVRLENETVWLTQPLMADLFQTTQQNVSLHIRNIYEEGELAPEATHKDFLSVRQEGGRQVRLWRKGPAVAKMLGGQARSWTSSSIMI